MGRWVSTEGGWEEGKEEEEGRKREGGKEVERERGREVGRERQRQ